MSDCLTHSWSDDVVECLYCKIEILETKNERLEAILAKIKQNLKVKLINPVKSPRYDKVYVRGVEWLDNL